MPSRKKKQKGRGKGKQKKEMRQLANATAEELVREFTTANQPQHWRYCINLRQQARGEPSSISLSVLLE